MIGHILIGDRLWRVAHISRRNPQIAPSEIHAYDAAHDAPRRVRWLLAERTQDLDAACSPFIVDAEPTPLMEQAVAEALGFLPKWACRALYEARSHDTQGVLQAARFWRDEGAS